MDLSKSPHKDHLTALDAPQYPRQPCALVLCLKSQRPSLPSSRHWEGQIARRWDLLWPKDVICIQHVYSVICPQTVPQTHAYGSTCNTTFYCFFQMARKLAVGMGDQHSEQEPPAWLTRPRSPRSAMLATSRQCDPLPEPIFKEAPSGDGPEPRETGMQYS